MVGPATNPWPKIKLVSKNIPMPSSQYTCKRTSVTSRELADLLQPVKDLSIWEYILQFSMKQNVPYSENTDTNFPSPPSLIWKWLINCSGFQLCSPLWDRNVSKSPFPLLQCFFLYYFHDVRQIFYLLFGIHWDSYIWAYICYSTFSCILITAN